MIKQRESGTKIDKILITDDMGYVPFEMGEQITTTTTSISGIQKEYCSTDPTLILHGAIPEEGTVSVTIPDNLQSATSASLFLTLFDADIFGEGYISINENDPIDLPVDPYDSLSSTFELPININELLQGENTIQFTHVDTWGYEVQGLCFKVSFPTSVTTTTIPLPRPTTTTTTVKPDTTPPRSNDYY